MLVGLMATTVDLDLVHKILSDALGAVDHLNGTVIDDTTLGNKPKEAVVNRELLNLVDSLLLASTLVKNEYWMAKGLISYAV